MAKKKIVDLYNLGCSVVMNKVNREIDQMGDGDVLEVNCDSLCALSKIRRLCMERDYSLDVYRLDKNTMRYIIGVQNEQ